MDGRFGADADVNADVDHSEQQEHTLDRACRTSLCASPAPVPDGVLFSNERDAR